MDIERLRKMLLDRYGTAAMQFPAAMADVVRVENASADELIRLGLKEGILEITATEDNGRNGL